MKRALISRDAPRPDFHDPVKTTDRFARLLEKNGFETVKFDTFDCFEDLEYIKQFDLVVYSWTMSDEWAKGIDNLRCAVRDFGVGLTGCHGGLCDSLRYNEQWQYMTGGQWVAHPGDDTVRYKVNVTDHHSEITEGIKDFEVISEQYYMHVDPGNDVLATTTFYDNICGKDVVVPAAWTKYFGKGRVFYLSVGHTDDVFDYAPDAERFMEKGMLWAARAL